MGRMAMVSISDSNETYYVDSGASYGSSGDGLASLYCGQKTNGVNSETGADLSAML